MTTSGACAFSVSFSRCSFAGKERDAESGNDYFGARYYASSMGRWMSPDPSQLVFTNLTNPQALNLYAYVMNNPLIHIDPNGWDCVYFNDSGSGVESVDHNSNSGECGSNGGDWVNGYTQSNWAVYNGGNDTCWRVPSSLAHSVSILLDLEVG
jgi:RHS repeat-associated protein